MSGSAPFLSFPFRIGDDGRTARAAERDEHIRDELIQLLLTSPGERPFLPEFGTPVRRMVFENVDDAAAGMVRAAVSDAVSRWLGHRVEIEELEVAAEDGAITVDLRYRVAGTEDSRTLRFQRGGG